MEQHPIPGAITTYKFKLVGDMTLKQFLELAFGVVTAWIIFNSSLNFFFKWTLGPFFAFLGFALAFLPIEDRPLDQWIINFVKAIYSPTQFIYRIKSKKLDFLETAQKPTSASPLIVRPGQNQQLGEYLESLPRSANSAFDQAEAKYLDYIANLFGALGNKIIPSAGIKNTLLTPLTKTGTKGVRVRQLSHPQMCLLPHAVVFNAPDEPKQAAMPIVKTPAAAKAVPARPTPRPQADQPVAKTPKSQPPAKKPDQPPEVKPAQPVIKTTAPVFATGVILPQKPERPNLIAGITLDHDGKIIPGVILEIRDSQGFPVRALKSNKLGQFFIATALPDGIYQISAEHDGHKFAIIKLEAKNEIIPPLKIQAVV